VGLGRRIPAIHRGTVDFRRHTTTTPRAKIHLCAVRERGALQIRCLAHRYSRLQQPRTARILKLNAGPLRRIISWQDPNWSALGSSSKPITVALTAPMAPGTTYALTNS